MAVYTQYSQTWLEDPDSIKIILVSAQVYNVQTALTETLLWSNAPYVTSDGVLAFSAIIRRDVTLSETLRQDGSGAMTFGDIELNNSNGELDLYLDSSIYVWSNRVLKIYYGDPQWSCSSTDVFTKFQLIFNGLTDDVDSRSRNTLNLKIRDKLEQLNTPLTEDKLGTTGTWNGGQQNQDAIKPIVFGEAFNVTPLIIDPSTLRYQFNNGISESLIEIRDNGMPLYNISKPQGATVDLTTGTFTLPYAALGAITCSVQGVKTPVNLAASTISATPLQYSADLATIIATIVTQYGRGASGTRPSARFTAENLDFANLQNFSTLAPCAVNAVIQDTQNVLAVCRTLAQSVGAQIFVNRLGKLQLLRYGTGYSSNPPVTAITDQDILYNSLVISQRSPIFASVKLGYAKNYTVQRNLQTSIPADHKESLATEWLTVTSSDPLVAGQFELSLEAQQVDTALINTQDASTECLRRLEFNKKARTVYKFTGTSKLLGLVLGQELLLTHSRYNLSTGWLAQVVSLSPNWSKGTVEVEVLVLTAIGTGQTYALEDYFQELYAN